VLDNAGHEIERTFDWTGYTEVHWDSSESKAVECRDCGWQQDAANDSPALEELKVIGWTRSRNGSPRSRRSH
jgi:hypothetical protein